MRLIDAEPLREKLCEHIEKAKSELWVNALCTFVKVLDLTPTIDAVPVVRCKDCKWSIKDDWICGHPNNNAWNISTEHYCGYGERKDDDKQ